MRRSTQGVYVLSGTCGKRFDKKALQEELAVFERSKPNNLSLNSGSEVESDRVSKTQPRHEPELGPGRGS